MINQAGRQRNQRPRMLSMHLRIACHALMCQRSNHARADERHARARGDKDLKVALQQQRMFTRHDNRFVIYKCFK